MFSLIDVEYACSNGRGRATGINADSKNSFLFFQANWFVEYLKEFNSSE